MKKVLSLLVICSLLTGCIGNPITAITSKFREKKQAVLTQKTDAAADKLQAAMEAHDKANADLVAAKDAEIKNLKDLAQQKVARVTLADTYFFSADDLLRVAIATDVNPNVQAAAILTGYGRTNSDPLTEDQRKWLAPIVSGLVSNVQSAQLQAKQALQDKQKAQDEAKGLETALNAKETALEAASSEKLAVEKKLSQTEKADASDLNSVKAKLSSYVSKTNKTLQKHGFFHTLIIDDFILPIAAFFTIAGLLKLGSELWPPLKLVSVPLDDFIDVLFDVLQRVCQPIHLLIEKIEDRISKKINGQIAGLSI